MSKNNESNISIPKELSEGLVLHKDLQQEIIITEENRFRLYLIEYSNSLKGKSQWISSFSVFLTLIITISTVSFQTVYSISKELWQAFFIISTIFSFFWFIFSAYKSFMAYKKGGIEALIKKLKNET